ncbi:hypothetical protein BOX15_Mlig030875g3 [Macrostomum lignano]|uniref:Uncharacterized protein n=1 Tax=Macrostomum lignano TaxID=282301 RepID=A0A267DDX3_9PLAT|nr:hypothetical protein BOX15_Mlig030875g3 [Macrostomum lignano]
MFGNPFGEFQQDPFFDFGAASPFGNPRRHHQHALRFDSHAAGRARSVPGHGGAFAEDLQHQQRRHQHRSQRRNGGDGGGEWPPATSSALVPRGPSTGRGGGLALPGYSFGLPQFDRVFEGVERMMSDAGERMLAAQEASQRPDFNGRVYSHASVYAYRSDGSGEPQVYQAVSESRAGPGGVRETRKALKDSRSREERIAVGHHIGGRGHTVERRRNTGTGQQQEDHHYDGIDESEGQQFDREWDRRAARIAFKGGAGGGGLRDGRSRHHRAITDGRH